MANKTSNLKNENQPRTEAVKPAEYPVLVIPDESESEICS